MVSGAPYPASRGPVSAEGGCMRELDPSFAGGPADGADAERGAA